MCAFGMLEMAAQASVREESMSQSQAAPVAPGERIVTLDVLRAFALLGILVMNMPFFFSSWWSSTMPEQRWPAGHDRVAWWFMDTLFSGKFNSLWPSACA